MLFKLKFDTIEIVMKSIIKKSIILIGIVILLAIIAGGYYWWQKRQAGQPLFQTTCDSLKNIPSAQYAPENVRARFLECFPERVASSNPATPTPGTTPVPAAQEQGPTCDELKTILSAQYAPPAVRDKFLKCFPERK